MIPRDGDIVRGLGFVTIYAAYMEERIDEMMRMLSPIRNYDSERQLWPVGRKFKHIKRILSLISPDKYNGLKDDLTQCKALFVRRNEVVHGRIYGGFERPATLTFRGRAPDREICAEELYDLAEEFSDMDSVIYRPMIFDLLNDINAYVEKYSINGYLINY